MTRLRARMVLACAAAASIVGFGVSHLALSPSSLHSSRPASLSRLCTVGSPGVDDAYSFDTLLGAELPNGLEVIGTSHSDSGHIVIVLHAITPSCGQVKDFGTEGTATITVTSRSSAAEIDTMIATKSGELLLGGSDGSDELVGRVLGDGHLDLHFGLDGWARFRPPEKPVEPTNPPVYTATSLSEAASGSVFVGANDGQAHCCIESFVSEFGSSGDLVPSFGDHGSVALPQLRGSYTTNVVAQSGSVLVEGEDEGMGCGFITVVRVEASGSLDGTFDARVGASLKAALPVDVFFAPVVVGAEDGGFDLLGDAAATCGPVGRSAPSYGLGLGFTSTGRLDRAFGDRGRLRFQSDNAFWVSTWGARLVDGELLLVTVAYSPRAEDVTALTMREFAANGRIDERFGRGGTVRLDSKPVLKILNSPNIDPNVVLVAAPGASEIVAMASRDQIEEVRLQTSKSNDKSGP